MNNKNNPVETPRVTARITWMNSEEGAAKKAAANITIAGSFMVRGVSIVEGANGLFISMPQREAERKGEKVYYEVAHPVTAEMRQAIQDAVFDAYTQSLAIAQQYRDSVAERQKEEQASETQTKVPDVPITGDEQEGLPFSVEENIPAEDTGPIMGLMM